MRVAHFITPSGFYGAEQWVLTFLKHSVTEDSFLICTSRNDQTLIQQAKKIGVPTSVIDIAGNFSLVTAIKKLTHLLKNENIDILHTHGYKSDIIGYFSARAAGIKIISTPHGWDLQSGIKVKLYDIVDRFILRFFDKVVPLSNGLLHSLNHISSSKLLLINNLVDLQGIPSEQDGDIKLITYIGRLTDLKRVKDIIVAMSLLPDDVTLQIIGDGPNYNKLVLLSKQLNLESKVRFLGYRSDRLELLNNSGILVLASISEGVSRTLMEAMAMKKVVVGSDIPGNRNLITNNETGFLFPVGDSAKLAEILLYIITGDDSQKVALNGGELIKKSFAADSIVSKYNLVYQQILD